MHLPTMTATLDPSDLLQTFKKLEKEMTADAYYRLMQLCLVEKVKQSPLGMLEPAAVLPRCTGMTLFSLSVKQVGEPAFSMS